jgi:NAD(P)H-hydrate epimerase
MPKIVTLEQMRAIEKAADAGGHSYAAMMDNAGMGLAERILAAMDARATLERHPRVTVLVGPGNNGGDGLVGARYAKEDYPDAEISCYLLTGRDDKDAEFVAAREAGVFIADYENDKQQRVLKNLVAGADILVDALFGIGVRLPLEGDASRLLSAVGGVLSRRAEDFPAPRATSPTGTPHALDSARPYIIAVDCPSGLDADTGEIDQNTLYADETVTFAAAKPGLLQFPGTAAVGELWIAGIGLPAKLKELHDIPLELSDAASVAALLPNRPADSHKGTFGKAFIVAGSMNYIGAAYLAASSAYRIGAGLVTLAVPQVILAPLASQLPEATWVLLPHNMGVINESAARITRSELDGYAALLVGPGIGDEDETRDYLVSLLQPEGDTPQAGNRRIGLLRMSDDSDEDDASEGNGALPPLVIDADGLNVLAKIDDWPSLLPSNTIITPHPREFARLAGIEDTAEVQANRLQLAQQKAKEWGVIVVLKGAFTVVAAPDGESASVSPFASAKLATAGTGDVLAGAITGLLAQGMQPYAAAVAGVWLHGWAGTFGTINRGALASDVMFALGEALEATSVLPPVNR